MPAARLGGRSSHVALRSFTERERTPTAAVPFHRAGTDLTQLDMARARGKHACFATSRDTASAVALTRRSHEIWLCARGHSSHVAPRSCTEGKRPSAGAAFFMSCISITASAARCAHAASLRLFSTLDRHLAQWRARACHAKAGCAVLEAKARTSHHGLAPKGRGLPLVQCQNP